MSLKSKIINYIAVGIGGCVSGGFCLLSTLTGSCCSLSGQQLTYAALLADSVIQVRVFTSLAIM